MVRKTWQEIYAAKLSPARDALGRIGNGQTVFVGSGAGEPVLLTDTLASMASEFCDLEIIHLAATQDVPRFARPELADSIRYNTIYIGGSAGATPGSTDCTPLRVSELPAAMEKGLILVDVALIQVAPPDELGLCSLGISVDATKAAVERAGLVIAQVNDRMPVTMGDSLVPVDAIDFLVEGTRPLIELPPPELDPVALTIGRHVAGLIGDGMTLHLDRGAIGAATMRYLDTKHDLGIHTDILSDDHLRLIRSRAVTNLSKRVHKGKSVATMVMGSAELYEFVDRNPYVDILPIEEVHDPLVIGQNRDVVSLFAVEELDLTGLARADSPETPGRRRLPSSMDFIDGARRARDGFTIVALPSTTPDGETSRIVARSLSPGVAISRASVDYVVTEYGVVNLCGLSIRERSIALISIAHPRYRAQLLEEAKSHGYVDADQVIPPESAYPTELEFTHTFSGGLKVFFRPVKPSDARRLQRLFYSLSPESVRLRYHGTIKAMPAQLAQQMAAVDYSQDMAIVGLIGPHRNRQIIAEGRYVYNPANNMGEFDIVVHEEYKGHGIGTVLANFLNKSAYARGLAGVYAIVIQDNAATTGLLSKAWPTAELKYDEGTTIVTVRFDPEEVERPKDSIVVYSGRFADYSYGEDHPFSPGRARATLRLMNQQGYLSEPWIRVEEPRLVTHERLHESHQPAYIDALEETNAGVWKDEFVQFGLGGDECPVFPGLFDYVLLYTSATITGVDLITNENANVVFNPTGGFHHASRTCAEGFCYVNDVIVAIDLLLARGYRVAYVDIDAHHGNGVQDAYYGDDRVLVVSTHESGKTLYPWSGFENEIGEGVGHGYNVNVPLPLGTDDEAYERVFKRVVTPAVKMFAPTVVVAVIGADTHRSDPLSKLKLTNNGMVAAISEIRDYANQLLLLGGGGYDLQSTTRAWARMWATANRIESEHDFLMVGGGAFLGSSELQGTNLRDMTYRMSGDGKRAIVAELDRIAAYHETNTFPLLERRGGSAPEPDATTTMSPS